jgi:hypothetical protein
MAESCTTRRLAWPARSRPSLAEHVAAAGGTVLVIATGDASMPPIDSDVVEPGPGTGS